ncbi:lipid-binding SYLF domain-containing protein [Thioalkalivibrio sp. ALR17-21]|uniref:lipid-binding SYLF domain-containing protein n=1 Tax=Thioalkalivibrio sp. ALR17-21 TaxID=1269813 RepID=UPI000412CB23|nr:lipid-binding SYLF domain-containing protein [Thioalkalivibrio sp. ALR17-21]
MRHFAVLLLALALILSLAPPASANPFARDVDPQDIVDRAKDTLTRMAGHPDYPALRADLREAHAVVIFPRVIRGGFFIGGSGGLGVALAWDEDEGDYSPVGFYSLGSVSFGVQLGGDAAEVVMVARRPDARDSLFASSMRLGGDAEVAAGPVGAGRSASVNADFISYARARGAYLGMSFEGSRLTVREDFNEAYYREDLRPVHILESRRVDHPGTQALRDALLEFRRDEADEAPARGGEDQRPEADPAEGGIMPDAMEVETL